MNKLLLILFNLFSLTTFGQYPFEKYPAIKSEVFFDWKIYDRMESKHRIDFTLTIPNFYSNKDSLSIQLTGYENAIDSSYLRIFKNNKQIHKHIETFPLGLGGMNHPDSAYMADFNGDGLKDIKFYVPNHGCGAFNYYAHVFYLFQKPNGTFTKISFTDLFLEFNYREERDFDGDGNYEIITQTFQSVGSHNYWTFNIYKYQNNTLTNVNNLDNYPIMIQLLYRENFDITNKISRDKMKVFARKMPDDYNKK